MEPCYESSNFKNRFSSRNLFAQAEYFENIDNHRQKLKYLAFFILQLNRIVK